MTSDPEDLRSADNEEKLVYRIIKEAGNKGVWIRDIRKECNLLRKQLEKTLRSLENKKLIKSIKTVSVSFFMYNFRLILFFKPSHVALKFLS